ncbi:MAG: hypothetical protein KME60_13315 [Cyanomargarita calcarea GSE-NOS-MK-12-04C]|jgi:hypothetical protein|uniref:Uncharacterized protein n=1 Tax=Cyanomargarita calcarea GSE-NOS-MK-12-04C TaxID=2839659 RepID=A0A951USY5_9CYAN|nr:hypothetical protein [Cyanomargarita calcarea GSE-NOS-MK-12-04C]
MKILFPLKRLVLATVAGIGFACLSLPQASLAGPGVGGLQDLNPQNTNDPLSQGSDQNPFNMFQLIHNANLGANSLNPEFFSEQRQQITDEASAFKAKQQQLLGGQLPVQQIPGQQQRNQGSGLITLPAIAPVAK